ncbi:MAG: hypothetical protein ACYS8S_01170 [Planctomycetota bacterium]
MAAAKLCRNALPEIGFARQKLNKKTSKDYFYAAGSFLSGSVFVQTEPLEILIITISRFISKTNWKITSGYVTMPGCDRHSDIITKRF